MNESRILFRGCVCRAIYIFAYLQHKRSLILESRSIRLNNIDNAKDKYNNYCMQRARSFRGRRLAHSCKS